MNSFLFARVCVQARVGAEGEGKRILGRLHADRSGIYTGRDPTILGSKTEPKFRIIHSTH